VPKWEDLRRLLFSVGKLFRKMIFIIDALDECESADAEDILSTLARLQDPDKPSVRLFITSRRHTALNLESFFRKEQVATVMEITATASDLETYVRTEIESLPKLRRLNQALKDDIVSATAIGAQGMYDQFCRRILICRLIYFDF
jgi:hypothetical protein